MSDDEIKEFLNRMAVSANNIGVKLFRSGADSQFIISYMELAVQLKLGDKNDE